MPNMVMPHSAFEGSKMGLSPIIIFLFFSIRANLQKRKGPRRGPFLLKPKWSALHNPRNPVVMSFPGNLSGM